MAVAHVTEIVSASPKSFEDAIKAGFQRAAKTLRNITGFTVTEWRAKVKEDAIEEYRVTLRITFLLQDTL